VHEFFCRDVAGRPWRVRAAAEAADGGVKISHPEHGATIFDASVGGLGGCPFAPRATGNVATEDLANLLGGEGIETGLDLDALIGISAWLEGLLGHTLDGYLYRAGLF